jgi:hypothetical protein
MGNLALPATKALYIGLRDVDGFVRDAASNALKGIVLRINDVTRCDRGS